MHKNGLWNRDEPSPRLGVPKPLMSALLLALFLASVATAMSASERVSTAGDPGSKGDTCTSIDVDDSAAAAQASQDHFLRWAIAAHRSAARSSLVVVSRDSEGAQPSVAGSSETSGTTAAPPRRSASYE